MLKINALDKRTSKLSPAVVATAAGDQFEVDARGALCSEVL